MIIHKDENHDSNVSKTKEENVTVDDDDDATAADDDHIDNDLKRILKSASIESAPIDPSSMIALRKMISERRRQQKQQREVTSLSALDLNPCVSTTGWPSFEMNHEDKGTSVRNTDTPTVIKQPPLPSMSKSPPDSTETLERGDHEIKTNITNSNNNNINIASLAVDNSSAADAAPTTAALMAHISHQTTLLLQLQRQVQALHQKLDYMQYQHAKASLTSDEAAAAAASEAMNWGSPMESSTNSDDRSFNFTKTRIYMRPSLSSDGEDELFNRMTQSQPEQPHDTTQQQQQGRRMVMRTRTVIIANPGSNEVITPTGPTEQAHQSPDGQQQQQQQTPLLFRIFFFPFRLILQYVRFEYQVLQALYRMGRREVRPLDGGILMQIFFVLLVIAKSSKKTTKLRFLSVLVILGFLYHMKVLSFLYKFFVTQNVPLRIWKGLDPEGTDDIYPVAGGAAAAAAPPPPGGQPLNGHPPLVPNNNALEANNAAAAARGNFWENTFFMGAIAPPNNDNQADHGGGGNIIVRVLWDIFYLFGSFFFSIFPMWRPEQRPRPVPLQQQELDGQNLNNDNDNNNVNNPPPLVDDNGGDMGPIPQVQPPRDAMEPTDSDDDDD